MGGIQLPYKPPGSTVQLPGASFAGLGRLRKIALIGNAPTVHQAPWSDPTWEIWAHAASAKYCERVDRYFDLHPKSFWVTGKKWDPNYAQWLQRCPTPIFMQRHYHDVPQSVAYPRVRVLAEYRRYLTSQGAWMIALALTEGVTHLGVFGIHYANDQEHAAQRAGFEYWLGVAEGKGVQLVIPEGNPVLRTPSRLYGYESHDEGKLHDSYRLSFGKPTVTGPAEGKTLHPCSEVPLADLGVPVDWDHSGHPPGHTEPVRGEEDGWQPTQSGAKGSRTTTSRTDRPPAKSGSSRAKRRRAKSSAASRSRTR